ERHADACLRDIAERRAERAGDDAEERELAGIEPHQRALRRAEATHHRAAVEVALDVAPRAERDGDAGEHCGKQRRQCEEALRALDRRAELRPARLQRLDALAAPPLA